VERVLQKMRPSTASIQALILALVVAGAASQVTGQAGTGQTVIQKATEQFENSPLKTTALGQGLFVFSGDGGDVTAIVDNGSTLIIDSGVDTRVTELSDAIFKATMRPVTRLVNTHWHFDHTSGNVFFGSAGVTIIAQENVKKRLSSVQSAFRWLARWSLSSAGTPNNHLFKQHDTASRPAAADIDELRACPYRWRHSRLCLSGECRGSRRHFLQSLLSHHRSSVRRINRWRDSFP